MASEVEKAFEAVRTGNAEILAALLGANPALAGSRDKSGVSLLLSACYHRRAGVVESILAAAGPLDIFEASAVEGGTERGRELLESDPALAGAYSSDGFTPLHLAAYFGREAMAILLLDGGADPSAVSRNPMSLQPIHSAAVSRSLAIVKALLQQGADASARQQGGWTPLHAAAFNGDLPMAQVLVEHGAELALESDDGKTPLDLAQEKGQPVIAGWLRSLPASLE
jgi:ankyrin repeat protein